ncbi:HAD family hydrolase [Erwinia piriflorinigrans]|uniref:Putative phospatase n=1 Tax=Erwinia piriflorinigrans CFBP 5888 TaxID=1161919 RepID=V5Z707_9GAMM|nr:HAD family hydrolase [Erwinia piriflorinigrans]CCG86764.1 putative phospatase [Erwinia piriflorinigrans CFBP 5888]
MDLALFDLDETLISEDSTGLWLRWLVSQGFAPAALLEQERLLMEQYYRGSLSMEEYMQITLSPLVGKGMLTVQGWVRRFIQRDILPRVYPAARERLHWHQQRGDTVMIISASGEHLVSPIAQQLGAHGALAIGVEILDDRYSGQTYGTMTYQQGKVTRLKDWLAWQKPFEQTWAYSDSINDLPMLEHADRAYVINPQAKLDLLAQQRGWDVCHWVK